LGKTYYGIKARVVLLGTPLGNLLGTYWELEWNKGKMKKNILSSCPHSPTQNLKEKKIKAL
jgi:hypothetical protein